MKKRNRVFIFAAIIVLSCIVIFCSKDLYHIIKFIIKNDQSGLKAYLTAIRLKSVIIIGLIQIIQIIFAVLPSEFIQIASFLNFGPKVGFIIIYLAVLIGSIMAFFITKLFKSYNKNANNHTELIETKYKKTNITLTVFLLYFLPAIPYGIISYYASNKKISFLRFLLITMIGVIPSILMTLVGAGIFKRLYLKQGIIVLVIFLILSIILLLFNFFMKRLDKTYANNSYRKPNWFLFNFLRITICPSIKRKFKVVSDVSATKNKKGPYVLLSSHQSPYDFVFAGLACGRRRFNTVGARYFFYNKWLRRLLTAVGVFPKDLFNVDINAIKSILNTIKNNQILLLMPEGRLSTVGYSEEIVSTSKLLKKLNVDVYGMKTNGGYYSCGKGFKNNVGKIELKSFLIIHKEELNDLSLAEIDEKIKDSLHYDDAVFLEENKHLEFKKVPDLSKLPGLIYSCPECNSKNSLTVENNQLICTNCHLKLSLNKRYEFIKNNDYYKLRTLKEIHLNDLSKVKEFLANDDFKLSSEVILRSAHGKNNKIIPVGKGVITFTKDVFLYEGTMDDKEINLSFDSKTLQSIPFAIADSFEIYRDNEFYAFCPVNKNEAIMWVMMIEENYKLRYQDEK